MWPDGVLRATVGLTLASIDNHQAKKLADDFDIHPLPPGQSAPIPKLPAEVMERKEEQRVLGLLVDYERLLTQWKEDFAPAMPDKEQTRRVCDAAPQNQQERVKNTSNSLVSRLI